MTNHSIWILDWKFVQLPNVYRRYQVDVIARTMWWLFVEDVVVRSLKVLKADIRRDKIMWMMFLLVVVDRPVVELVVEKLQEAVANPASLVIVARTSPGRDCSVKIIEIAMRFL